MRRLSPPLRVFPLLLAGILSCDRVPPEAITQCQSVTVVPPVVKTDILFVVDDSNSMLEEQENLANNFDAFISRLNTSPFKNDFQIGITSTSVDLHFRAPDGSVQTATTFQFGPNIGKPYPAGALVAVDESGKYVDHLPRILTGDMPSQELLANFRRNVKVGTSGSGKEQGLLAARLALTDRIADGKNAGFLRPGAKLAVVIVSDADDCSDPKRAVALHQDENCYGAEAKGAIEPVKTFVDALRGPLADERRDVVVAVISNVDPATKEPKVSCAGPEATPADRYKVFVNNFRTDGLIDDICSPSFRDTLDSIAGLLEPPESVTLDPAPHDPRMLTARVKRADGGEVSCRLAFPGDSDIDTADAVYEPPVEGAPARVKFQNACRINKGDTVEVKLLCAG